MNDLSLCYIDKPMKSLRPCSVIQEPSCCCLVTKLCLTLCDSMACSPARVFCPWDFPGKNTGVGCHFLLQGIFLAQESNPCLLHWQADSLPLSHQEALQEPRKPHKCIREHAGKRSGNQRFQLLYLGRIADMMNFKIESFH